MNLLRMFSRSASMADAPVQLLQTVEAPSNVVQLETSIIAPVGLNSRLEEDQLEQSPPPQSRGLLDAPELRAFFTETHFGHGRHNGSNYRTQKSLELGQRALVSKFQNVLSELIERRQTKSERLTDKLLETEGICSTTTGRLREACTRLKREMAVLQEQSSYADERKGWVLEALNLYQIGFGKGMREAIEFELLMD